MTRSKPSSPADNRPYGATGRRGPDGITGPAAALKFSWLTWAAMCEATSRKTSPIGLDGTRTTADAPPPLLGEHAGEILSEAGYSTEEVERMLASVCRTDR